MHTHAKSVTQCFMKKGQTHPSSCLYRDFITDAFLELIQTKPLSEITITELCEHARISRRTFYRHFKDLHHVAEYYFNYVMEKLAETLTRYMGKSKVLNRKEFAQIFFSYLEPYATIISCFHRNGLGDILFTAYIRNLSMLPQDAASAVAQKEPTDQYFPAFLLGGLWSLLTVWIQNGLEKSPEELSEIAFGGELHGI